MVIIPTLTAAEILFHSPPRETNFQKPQISIRLSARSLPCALSPGKSFCP